MKASKAKGLPATNEGRDEAVKFEKRKTWASEMLSIFERLFHERKRRCTRARVWARVYAHACTGDQETLR